MSINKKSLVGPDPSGKFAAAPHGHSSTSHPVLGEVKKVTRGPGQSWVNLTKSDVEEYAREHPQSGDKKAGPSFLAKLGSIFKRGPKNR